MAHSCDLKKESALVFLESLIEGWCSVLTSTSQEFWCYFFSIPVTVVKDE